MCPEWTLQLCVTYFLMCKATRPYLKISLLFRELKNPPKVAFTETFNTS